MRYQLAAVLLAPLLLLQGRHVRRVTPVLPEPEGVRHGTEGSGEHLRLLIVGDSSAAGVGVDTQATALSGQLASRLAPHFHLSWHLIAKTGSNVRDLLALTDTLPQEAFDVAVVAVGVNDVTGGTSPKNWCKGLVLLCEHLQSRFNVQEVLLTQVPPMHAFPALPQPLRWYLGNKAASFNRSIQALTLEHDDWKYVQPAFPLSGAFMAADGFHPNQAAYAVWAEQLTATIRKNS